MSNGIRISQQGVSVKRAAEYQMVLDDRWPLMDFEFAGELKISHTTNDRIIYVPLYKHNLGFVPGFHAYLIETVSLTSGVVNEPPAYEAIGDTIYAIYFRTDSTATTTETIVVRVFLGVYRRDFSKTYQAPTSVVPAGASSGPSQYGIKVLARGSSQGMKSSAKKDYNLHTNAKPLGIHMHGTFTVVSGGALNVDHLLGYPPTFFAARRYVEAGSADPFFNQLKQGNFEDTLGKGRSTAVRLTITGAQSALSGDFVVVVLKDPVDTAL